MPATPLHLAEHGYTQLAHSPALFRNQDGSIRFSLVVDDFAVVWNSKAGMDHFLTTLRKLYTVKVDWKGQKYLGMTIAINRVIWHVTISMPGYIKKTLLRFGHKLPHKPQHLLDISFCH